MLGSRASSDEGRVMRPNLDHVASHAPYDALASVYDRWTKDNDFDSWSGDLDRRLLAAGLSRGASVLELCVGTGLVAEKLAGLGWRVSGIDRSRAMLDRAEVRLGPDTMLVHGDLAQPVESLPAAAFDAAICTFDSLNYFVAEGALAQLFATVAASLRKGGVFIFDINSRVRLETIFGNSHYGDDLGDFGYVWRNRTTTETHQTEFLITLWEQRPDGAFDRRTERHVQRWFAHDELERHASCAGLDVVSITDDYQDAPARVDSLREVWTLSKPARDDA
jgi:SAM-dependent methyltransferase